MRKRYVVLLAAGLALAWPLMVHENPRDGPMIRVCEGPSHLTSPGLAGQADLRAAGPKEFGN